jgi:hypothetical protein
MILMLSTAKRKGFVERLWPKSHHSGCVLGLNKNKTGIPFTVMQNRMKCPDISNRKFR